MLVVDKKQKENLKKLYLVNFRYLDSILSIIKKKKRKKERINRNNQIEEYGHSIVSHVAGFDLYHY